MQTSEFFLGCRRMAALALRLMLLVCAWLIPASTAFANKWVVVASCPKNQHGQFTQLCMCRGRGDISQPEQAWWSVFDSSTYSDASEFGGAGWGNFGGVEAAPVRAQGRMHSLCLTLPPLSTLILEHDSHA